MKAHKQQTLHDRILRVPLFTVFITLFVLNVYCNIPGSSEFTLPHHYLLFSRNADIIKIKTSYSRSPVFYKDSFSVSELKSLLHIKIAGNEFADSCMQSAKISVLKTENDSMITIQFTSDQFLTGMIYRKVFSVFKNQYSINCSFQLSGDSIPDYLDNCEIQLSLRYDTARQDKLYPVIIGKRVIKIDPEKFPFTCNLNAGQWIGVRDRFFVACIKNLYDSVAVKTEKGKLLLSESYIKDKNYEYQLYCGPVVYKELKKTDRNLTRLLYPLWFWMRWLSIGLLYVFDTLLNLFNSVIPAVIFLSVCVKIIIAPLFKIANKWQVIVNQQSSLLQPRLDEVKRKYKGEEQTKQTLAVYKELGISPLYSLKSLLSAAIQIPVFFAAYHMLGEHIALHNVSFLWIKDLSSPDHLMKLPFTIPLLGNYFNILPFIMTIITIVTSWLHTDSSLSAVLQKKQRNNLYWMSALFFILLYTSPAGMVLYWTMNNFLALLSTIGTMLRIKIPISFKNLK